MNITIYFENHSRLKLSQITLSQCQQVYSLVLVYLLVCFTKCLFILVIQDWNDMTYAIINFKISQ